jgi:hypothetical protein
MLRKCKRRKMTHHILWRTEGSGTLSSERHGFQLVVQKLEKTDTGAARFLIFRPEIRDDAKAPLGSGAREDVQAAMAEAERMAERCAELGFLRTRAAR